MDTSIQSDNVTYGPPNEDGSIPVYWDGQCRGKIMPGVYENGTKQQPARDIRDTDRQ